MARRSINVALACVAFTCGFTSNSNAQNAETDAFGYKSTLGEALHDFEDISAAGPTLGTLGNDSAVSDPVSIGFPFRFYENEFDRCIITTAGYLVLGERENLQGAGVGGPRSSVRLPEESIGFPSNLIAPFWANLTRTPNGNPLGQVYHKTVGTAPNRRFIVQWEDVAYTPTTNSLIFQVKLFEGSNAIEFHYKKLEDTNAAGSYIVGIQDASRKRGINIRNGFVSSIEDSFFDLVDDNPDFEPFAIRFDRPIIVEVQSEIDLGTPLTVSAPRRIGVGRVSLLGTDPPTQDGQPPGNNFFYDGLIARFSAPEFIYFNRNGEELAELGEAGAPESEKAYYRARNVGYAISGQNIQGTDLFFEEDLREDITVIWRWALDYAVFVESTTLSGAPLSGDGIGNPTGNWQGSEESGVGRFWVPADQEFTASVDRVVGSGTLGTDSGGRRFTAKSYQLEKPGGVGPVVPLGDAGNRLVTEAVTINDWLKVRWLWAGQVRYLIEANRGPGEATAPFLGESFVRIYKATSSDEIERTIYDEGPDTPVWVDLDSKVEVGCFYRSLDRCYTVGDFAVPLGGDLSALGSDLSNFADSMVPDAMGAQRVARTTIVSRAANPTDLNFFVRPTVFRAEIPLGGSFDANNPDAQLVPSLCDGAVLRAGNDDPSAEYQEIGVESSSGTSSGRPLRWDAQGKRLFPVRPGSYRYKWPDTNDPSKTYQIEIVTGYPGETAPLGSESEDSDGLRRTTSTPNTMPVRDGEGNPVNDGGGAPLYYVTSTTLAGTEARFPASPGAHYRHRFDGNPARTPPTKLDPSRTDRWHFEELTFSDNTAKATVDLAEDAKPFAAAGEGRSVVLYRYRPNPDEIAIGSISEENLAVRVVSSTTVAPIVPDNPANPLGRRGFRLGEDEQGIVSRAGDESFDAGQTFLIDFWFNVGSIGPGDGPVKILSTGPDKLEVTIDPASSTVTASYFGLTATRPLPGPGWNHYVMHVFGDRFFGVPVTLLNFYVDGVRAEAGVVTSLMPSGTSPRFDVASGLGPTSMFIGSGAKLESSLLIDQLRSFSLTGRYLDGFEQRMLRDGRRSLFVETESGVEVVATLDFDFETAPSDPGNGVISFPSLGSKMDAGVGPIGDDPGTPDLFDPFWSRSVIEEVATRIQSPLDTAGFDGDGYILGEVSNYNASLYQRDAEVGLWGPVFPVNDHRLFVREKSLEIAYYENPSLQDPTVHPNVAWPYIEASYNEVTFPKNGPHRDKAIYIASRLGSEGVDQTGELQEVFSLEAYADFEIYNQPDPLLTGYNPNEEHALAAPANRAGLKVKEPGEDLRNNPPLAAFALQKDINVISGLGYTSEPWVLAQFTDLTTGKPGMAAYQVFATRDGVIPFPRPDDATVAGTPGLEYEPAAIPENRFLTIDPEESYDFSYQFEYPAFAGDLLIPPYPLNLVIGNLSMVDDWGGNLRISDTFQRTLWRDINGNAWIVSGDGRFFHQFFYPLREDFFPPSGNADGGPIAWLPPAEVGFRGNNIRGNPDDDSGDASPVKVIYSTSWRSDYPKLKRGETLTYQGGEYFSETPGSEGLPAVVAMAASEVVFDSANPDMVFDDSDINDYSARIVRPLDRREAPFTVSDMKAAKLEPADTEKIFVVAERWYFKELPGSLQKRFYFDSLVEKLVFRGYLNDKDSGDSELTSGPDPLNILEPNVLTAFEIDEIKKLATTADWLSAVNSIARLASNPARIREQVGNNVSEIEGRYLAGLKETANRALELGLREELGELEAQNEAMAVSQEEYNTRYEKLADQISKLPETPSIYSPLDSLGAGSSLVPNPNLLIQDTEEPVFVTIAENNREELNGAAISLHIIEIIPDRYRGAIKVIEAADAFSEKISLQHNGEFGANTDDLYYEWWIRDSGPLDVVADEILADGSLVTSSSSGQSLWQKYAEGPSLHSLVFEGRPDVVLADKLVLMRYRHLTESDWKLVPFEFSDAADQWQPGSPAPFQWAGAANSPQIQADGSKRYIPQLVMGWVKRILDRINPYEARYTDFFGNESPATYSSQIQIAGAPYAGKVALNSDKNVIENTGLIELYETVLARAKELSIDNSTNPVSTEGINQALLLAATRLAVLYELLAREAYSDAQDSTITVTDDNLASVATFTHAFQGLESDLLNEELALLRGTDFRKSYPVFNRAFWNYTKGLGEAAYNVNYNIYDENTDGFINEDDARALYPQGHGDAWGHFVSALDMHYELLQQPVFSWKSRSELYALLQNVIEVDYLDEKTFAKLAAGKARAGRDIVRGTYRLKYTNDPDGQWQGYSDGVDPARAWGVSEWSHRAGQGAYFDWVVANALLPENAGDATPIENPENLDRLERSAAESEIAEVAAGLLEVQSAMDESNNGVNPLGFDSNAIAFDLDPTYLEVGSGIQGETHFEQIYSRALVAGANAVETLAFASQAGNKLRRIADDTDLLIVEAFRQDLDYRNRLIEIFGQPYDGTIGFGKLYPEGYEGPDTQLYAYLDRTKIDQIVPQLDGDTDGENVVQFEVVNNSTLALADNGNLKTLYTNVWGDTDGPGKISAAFKTLKGDNNYEFEGGLTVPFVTTADYGFQAEQPAWGQRRSYGRLQGILEEMLLAEVTLDEAVIDYQGFLQDWEAKGQRLRSELELLGKREQLGDELVAAKAANDVLIAAAETASAGFEAAAEVAGDAGDTVSTAIPGVTGPLAVSGGAPAKGAAKAGFTFTEGILRALGVGAGGAARAFTVIQDNVIALKERQIGRAENISEIEGLVEELVNLSGSDQPKRDTIGAAVQELEIKRQEYLTAVSEGFRLLREREAFNKVLAASVQKNRYQDMVFRLARNEAMSKYQSSFNHAARYAWLTAKAYDYETSLDPGHPAAATTTFDGIVMARQLGLWVDGEPRIGQGGIAEILATLNGNFQVLESQLGLNSLQVANEDISLRAELFRIGPGVAGGGSTASDDRWVDALKARIVPDLWQVPEFRQHCRPFATKADGPQPGLVLRFRTTISPGLNFFGRPLAAGDHAYSSSNFSTKVAAAGIFLDDYDAAGLATTPRAYLVPTGNDYHRVSTADEPVTRMWSVRDTRIPTPFTINQSQITSPGFFPSLDGLDGGFGEIRRHGDFRMYHEPDLALADDEQSTRLTGRSVWNSEWILIIPGAHLSADSSDGLERFAENVSDLKLTFKTYSHQGQ